MKNDGFLIEKSMHKRLSSNFSLMSHDHEKLFKKKFYTNIDDSKTFSMASPRNNNYNSLNCNIDLTNVNHDTPKIDKLNNNLIKRLDDSKNNFSKEKSFDFKTKFVDKIIEKPKISTRTHSKNESVNNPVINVVVNKKIEKKSLKSEILKNDQIILQSRNNSSNLRKGNLKNSKLVFMNPEDNNSSNLSNVIHKNEGIANVKFKQNNLYTKLNFLK